MKISVSIARSRSLVKAGCLVSAVPFVPVCTVCPLPMVNDRRPVWHGFYASTIMLVFFYLFGADLALIQLLTWPLGAGASPGGFGAEKSVCSCCPGAAQWEILRSIK